MNSPPISDGQPIPITRALENFDIYYARDYRSLVGLAYVLSGNLHAAEDLAQDALTEAHRQWNVVSSYDDPGAWVRRVMVNKSKSRFRRLGSETRALTKIGNRPTVDVAPSERSTEVWAAVRSLPTRQAQTVALYYWEDRSMAQIAEILDCSTETVKTHLKRGRAALAKSLASHEGEFR